MDSSERPEYRAHRIRPHGLLHVEARPQPVQTRCDQPEGFEVTGVDANHPERHINGAAFSSPIVATKLKTRRCRGGLFDVGREDRPAPTPQR